jgi:hypothetical protein
VYGRHNMRPITTAAVAATMLIAACGGSTPADQVRDTARHVGEAVTSPHPERACQYMVDRDRCIGSIAVANSMHLEVAAAVGMPADWRSRLAKAKITVSGDTARLAKARYVRRGDVWLVDNR